MRALVLCLSLLSPSSFAASPGAPLKVLNCLPDETPVIQGAERFFRLSFLAGGGASLEVASQQMDFIDATGGLALSTAQLQLSEGKASAAWGNYSLVAALHFQDDHHWAGTLAFPASLANGNQLRLSVASEYNVHCRDTNF